MTLRQPNSNNIQDNNSDSNFLFVYCAFSNLLLFEFVFFVSLRSWVLLNVVFWFSFVGPIALLQVLLTFSVKCSFKHL